MRRYRSLLAWLLLVAVAMGGVAGPVVHRVQHAVEQAAAADGTCHPAAVHTAEGPQWAETGADLFAPECTLCATRLLVVFPTPAPTSAPRVMGTTAVKGVSHVTTAHVAADRFIRGPPSLFEARPA